MPSPVDKYYNQVREKNPDYTEAQAWATAWSIYCKHVNPGSPSCKKSPSEYLKGKKAFSRPLSPLDEVLESAYFHVGNGGLTLRVVRTLSGKNHSHPNYRMDFEFTHMGAGTTGSFDMGHPVIVAWLIGALTNTLPKVHKDFEGKSFNPFRSVDVTTGGLAPRVAARFLTRR